jgi:hypothetical protein
MDAWEKFFRCVVRETGRQMHEHLDRFRVSLGDWLFAMVNWPTPDWEQQLQILVDHTRYYGLIIHPVSIQSIHDLVEARVNGTGPFAGHGPYRWDQPATEMAALMNLATTVSMPTTTERNELADAGDTSTRSSIRAVTTVFDEPQDTRTSGPKSPPALVAEAGTDQDDTGHETPSSSNRVKLLADQTAQDQSAVGPAILVAAPKRPPEYPWLELGVNAVLFPFGQYKSDSFATDFAAANKIFESCRIRVKLLSTKILTEAHTRKAGAIYPPLQGQPARAILDPAKLAEIAGPSTQGEITVYFVPELARGAAGQKISDDAAVVASRGASGNRRQSQVLAHELAHVMGLPHEYSDVRNLMVDITESDLKTLGLQRRWEEFRARYKGATATGTDLARRFYSFLYEVTANSVNIRPYQCEKMRQSPSLRAIK